MFQTCALMSYASWQEWVKMTPERDTRVTYIHIDIIYIYIYTYMYV